jgi:thiol reductant ABC exporter CydD subunit
MVEALADSDQPSEGTGGERRARFSGLDRRLGIGPGLHRLLIVSTTLGLAQTACVVVQAVLLATVIQRALFEHASLASVSGFVVGIALAFAARGVFGWVALAYNQAAADTVAQDLRHRLLRGSVDELGPTWLAGRRAGDLALSATEGVSAVETYLGRYFPQLVLAAAAPVALLVWVATTDWISALVLVALLLAVPPTMVVFGRRTAAETDRQWRRLSSLSARLVELVQGLPTLRVFGRAEYGRREVEAASEGLRQSTMQTLRVAFLSGLALELIAGLGTGLVAMLLGLRLLDGRVSLYCALAVLLVSPEVFGPVRRAAADFHASAPGRAAGERIAQVIEAVLSAAAGIPSMAEPPDPALNPLVLEGLTIRFADRSSPAIDHFSLTVQPGQKIALIGPSGSGKSTVLAAIMGLVPLDAGAIFVGGVDLSTVDPARWRHRVCWVPQRPHLFSGTIGDNIRIGRPDATDAQLDQAISLAGLDELLSRSSKGLMSPIGDGGLTLSAGERQRIAIARAVLHGGSLILLDEIGAHLDPLGRQKLGERLESWLDGRTLIVAAHHPEVIGHVDQIVDLDERRRPASDSTLPAARGSG